MYDKLKETEKAYWAGIIDGEGYLKLEDARKSNGSKKPKLTLKMTCEETVRRFAETFGLTWKKRDRTASIQDHWKDQYVSSVECQRVALICLALLPYFITKKKVAEEIAAFYKRKCKNCDKDFWSNKGMIYCCRKCERVVWNAKRRQKRRESFKSPS